MIPRIKTLAVLDDFVLPLSLMMAIRSSMM